MNTNPYSEAEMTPSLTADNTIDSEVDQLLIRIIENYTNALNKISVEQSNADDFDKHYKDIQAETARTIQQHYTPNHEIAQEANKAVVNSLEKLMTEMSQVLDQPTLGDLSLYVDLEISRLTAGKGQPTEAELNAQVETEEDLSGGDKWGN